jgi:hypothetical protein
MPDTGKGFFIMTELIDRLRRRIDTKSEAVIARFRDLIFKSLNAELSDAEIGELAGIATQERIDPDRVGELQREAKLHRRKEKEAGLVPATAAASLAADEELQKFATAENARLQKAVADRGEKCRDLRIIAEAAKGAQTTVETIEFRCPELFGDAQNIKRWKSDPTGWGKRQMANEAT